LSEVRGIEQVVNFGAVFYCKWIEKTLINPKSMPVYERIAGEELPWIPLFLYNNLIEAEEITSSFFLRRSDGMVLWTIELSLKIRENLELQEFPYDRQLFKLAVCTDTKFELWPCDPDFDSNLPTIFRRQYPLIAGSLSTAWQMEKLRIKNFNLEEHGIHGLQFEIFCCRNPGFYVINFGVVNFVIIILSLTTRAVDYTDFANRSQITLTLLLTLIAFKFVINSYVTQTNYLTYLDYYILSGLFILAAVILENYVISFEDNNVYTKRNEMIFYGSIFASWIFFHLFIFLGTYLHWFYPSWEFVIERDAIDGQYAHANNYGEINQIITPNSSRPTPSYASSRSQSFIQLFPTQNSLKGLFVDYPVYQRQSSTDPMNHSYYSIQGINNEVDLDDPNLMMKMNDPPNKSDSSERSQSPPHHHHHEQPHHQHHLQHQQYAAAGGQASLRKSAPRNMRPVNSFYTNKPNQRPRYLGGVQHFGGSASSVPPFTHGNSMNATSQILDDATQMSKM
jgi:hypothetical protein